MVRKLVLPDFIRFLFVNTFKMKIIKYNINNFSYRAYKARKQLATIDWNFHLNLPNATTNSGDEIVSRKYNKRTKQWDVKIVSTMKGYEYITVLMAKILNLRMDDVDVVTRNVSLNASDPGIIAATIANKPPPPSKDLLHRRSRFKK